MSVQVNDLLRERLRQLQRNEPYRTAEFQFHPNIDERLTVRISREWLRNVFDLLVDNAIEAMQRSTIKTVTVTTEQIEEQVEIVIADTGTGIPAEIRDRLGREKIPKAKGDRGLGMGMLLAQTIIQTYGGEILIRSTGPSGTTVVIRLPLERSRKG